MTIAQNQKRKISINKKPKMDTESNIPGISLLKGFLTLHLPPPKKKDNEMDLVS